MAIKDLGTGTRILIGLAGFSLLIALLSGEPDNDAWTTGSTGGPDRTGAGSAGSDVDTRDAWTSARPGEIGDAEGDGDLPLPPCDATAPFVGAEGTVVLPSDSPLAQFASAACVLDPSTGTGPAVARLQLALAVCHDQPVTVDGVYGEETSRAVAAVQVDQWLDPDGIYGPETAGAMRWPLAAGAAASADTRTGDAAEACGPPPR